MRGRLSGKNHDHGARPSKFQKKEGLGKSFRKETGKGWTALGSFFKMITDASHTKKRPQWETSAERKKSGAKGRDRRRFIELQGSYWLETMTAPVCELCPRLSWTWGQPETEELRRESRSRKEHDWEKKRSIGIRYQRQSSGRELVHSRPRSDEGRMGDSA